jgi:heat shock protein HslJ
MAKSLLEGLTGLVTPELLSNAARTIGTSEGSVASGLGAAFPTILAGLAGKAGKPDAMKSVFDLITNPANDAGVLRNPALAAGATDPKSPLGAMGGTLLSSLFGSQLSSVGELVTRSAGLPGGAGGSLLRMAAPLVVGFLGKRVATGGLNAAGLSSLLAGERDQIMRAAPAGLSSALGMGDLGRDVSPGAGVARAPILKETGSLPRWLWPALAALALLAVVWTLARNRGPDRTEQTVGALNGPVLDTADVAAPVAGLPSDLQDVTWEWVSFTTPVEQLQIDGPSKYTIRFSPDGKVAVKADCNRGTGSYAFGDDRGISFKPLALTRAACPAGSLSDRFVKEVGRASSYFIRDGDLYLELPADSGTLRFRRQA